MQVQVHFVSGLSLALPGCRSTDKEDIVPVAAAHNSDLVPGVYEGGLKLWECSIDLVNFMALEKMSLCGKKVLEIGCGAAAPGVFALTQGATVDFQDYNREVLSSLHHHPICANLV